LNLNLATGPNLWGNCHLNGDALPQRLTISGGRYAADQTLRLVVIYFQCKTCPLMISVTSFGLSEISLKMMNSGKSLANAKTYPRLSGNEPQENICHSLDLAKVYWPVPSAFALCGQSHHYGEGENH